jgi:hypothetical protein
MDAAAPYKPSDFISHNVPGIRRFCNPNKGLRSKTRAAKMWLE